MFVRVRANVRACVCVRGCMGACVRALVNCAYMCPGKQPIHMFLVLVNISFKCIVSFAQGDSLVMTCEDNTLDRTNVTLVSSI